MPPRIEGYITVDVSDYEDDLQIHADAEDIYHLMQENSVSIEEVMDHFDVTADSDTSLADVDLYIQDVADHEDIAGIINVCINRLTSDYAYAFNQMVEGKRLLDQAKAEAKVLTGGPHVSEIRPSS